MKKIRVAFIGFSHCHLQGFERDFANREDRFEIVGKAEIPPYTEEQRSATLKRNSAAELDIKLWDDYRELLSKDIDLAILCGEVSQNPDTCAEILGMGINVVVEKPMALDMAGAKKMYRAYKKSGKQLIINWPVAWWPTFNKAKELADSGIIGDVLRVHYRSPATCGPYPGGEYTPSELGDMWWYQHDKGGGSICDYAGYGCVLTTWIANKTAKRVSGFKKNFFLPFSDVEDYSVFTIDFGDSIGLIEGSWSTISNGEIPTGPVIYGSEGVIVADRYDKNVKVYKTFKPYVPTPAPDEVYTAEETGENLIGNIIKIFDGGEIHEMITPEFNMRVMAAFDAGRRSCESGNIETAENPFQF